MVNNSQPSYGTGEAILIPNLDIMWQLGLKVFLFLYHPDSIPWNWTKITIEITEIKLKVNFKSTEIFKHSRINFWDEWANMN